MHVTAREIKPVPILVCSEARVRCTGYDRPGIVYQVTILGFGGFNIDELTTDTIACREGREDETLFLLEGVVTAPESVHPGLREEAEGLRLH